MDRRVREPYVHRSESDFLCLPFIFADECGDGGCGVASFLPSSPPFGLTSPDSGTEEAPPLPSSIHRRASLDSFAAILRSSAEESERAAAQTDISGRRREDSDR